jgi:hypothetical protein
MATTTAQPPKDITSPTGYCSHRNHKKCPYRPGGISENGIALSGGGFYMCPCSCHMTQKHAVQGKRLQTSLAARRAAVTTEEIGKADAETLRIAQDAPVPASTTRKAAENSSKKIAETSPKSGTTQGKQSNLSGVGERPQNREDTEMTKTTANAIEITSIGPNGLKDATFHVHAAGCADIKRGIKATGKGEVTADYRRAEKNDMIVKSFRDMVEQDYSDIMAENEGSTWEDYTGEYRIFPCVTFPEDRKPAELVDAAKAKVAAKKAPAKKAAPKDAQAKATPAKAAKSAAKEGLSTAEKRDVRIKMAAVLREMRTSPINPLTAREMAYVEAHWLKYIDPDMDKARREAAAAR